MITSCFVADAKEHLEKWKKLIGLEVKQTGLVEDYERLKRIAKSLRLNEYYVVTKNFNSQTGFVLAVDV